RFSIHALLEGPLRGAGVGEVLAARLPWDALEVRLEGPGSDGTAEPGANLKTTVGFNLLTPDPGGVGLRYSAELKPLRRGDPTWQFDPRDVIVATDAARAPMVTLNLTAPKREGTYVLEVRSSWEPIAAHEGSRISRLIRGRRGNAPASGSATRRLTLTVLG